MYLDLPKFSKCCFCFPLRRGLLAWGYISLILMVLILIPVTSAAAHNFNNEKGTLKGTLILSVVIIITFGNIVMTILFLGATHMKNLKLLRVFYYYYIGITILSVLSYSIGTGYEVYVDLRYTDRALQDCWYTFLYLFMVGFFNFAVQTYMLLLIRSELLKLQGHFEFRFVKKSDESECMLDVHNEPVTSNHQ